MRACHAYSSRDKPDKNKTTTSCSAQVGSLSDAAGTQEVRENMGKSSGGSHANGKGKMIRNALAQRTNKSRCEASKERQRLRQDVRGKKTESEAVQRSQGGKHEDKVRAKKDACYGWRCAQRDTSRARCPPSRAGGDRTVNWDPSRRAAAPPMPRGPAISVAEGQNPTDRGKAKHGKMAAARKTGLEH